MLASLATGRLILSKINKLVFCWFPYSQLQRKTRKSTNPNCICNLTQNETAKYPRTTYQYQLVYPLIYASRSLRRALAPPGSNLLPSEKLKVPDFLCSCQTQHRINGSCLRSKTKRNIYKLHLGTSSLKRSLKHIYIVKSLRRLFPPR